MLLGVFNVAAEEASEPWGELLALGGGVDDGFASFDDGLIRVGAAEVSFEFAATGEAQGLLALHSLSFQPGPFRTLLLLLLPFLDEFRRILHANTAAILVEREIGESLSVQAFERGLVAVVAGGAEDFAAHAADAYAGEDALRFFEFHFFRGVILGHGLGVAKQVTNGFFAGLKQGTIGNDLEQAHQALGFALHLDAMTFRTGEDEASRVKQTEGEALALHVLGKHVQGFVLGLDRHFETCGNHRAFGHDGAGGTIIATAEAGLASARACAAAARATGWAVAARASTARAFAIKRLAATSATGVAVASLRASIVFTIGVGLAGGGRAEVRHPVWHEAQAGEVEGVGGGSLRLIAHAVRREAHYARMKTTWRARNALW